MQASVEKSPITLELTQRALKELIKDKNEKKWLHGLIEDDLRGY